jgi:hypothetical protein
MLPPVGTHWQLISPHCSLCKQRNQIKIRYKKKWRYYLCSGHRQLSPAEWVGIAVMNEQIYYLGRLSSSSAIDIKRKLRLLKLCYVPATCYASFKGIFAAATKSNNETNKVGCTCIMYMYQSIFLRCLWV